MTTGMTTPMFDPASRSASSWGSRLAGLRSHGATDDDPRVRECLAASFFWDMKRQADRAVERGIISAGLAEAYVGKLRNYSPEELLREPEVKP